MGEWESDNNRPLQDPWESDDIPLVHPCNEDKLVKVNAVFYSVYWQRVKRKIRQKNNL